MPTLTAIHPAVSLLAPYRVLLSLKLLLSASSFYSSPLFHRTLFRGSFVGLREPRDKYSICTFTCLSNNSLISSWISTKFTSILLLCMFYLCNNFQAKIRGNWNSRKAGTGTGTESGNGNSQNFLQTMNLRFASLPLAYTVVSLLYNL